MLKKLGSTFLIATIFVSFLGLFANLYICTLAQPNIYSSDSVPTSTTALILGARVYANGRLSDMAKDRVDTALALYQAGKVRNILVSGDHGQKNYDEVNTIKNYLLERGAKPADIFLDHAGFDTYDSLYRAKEIFELSDTIVVTQHFHLPRAVFIGNKLGITAYGVPADLRNYPRVKYNYAREWPARFKAFLSVAFETKPTFLGKKIPITGDSQLSWD